jgi:hypothetical protein
MWKERALLLAVSAALAGYVALWVLGEAVAGKDAAPLLDEQRYVRSGSLEAFPEGAADVFASGDRDDSWDESIPRRYVQQKTAVVTKDPESVSLKPPPASVSAPPMLLPLPGPTLENSEGLPRWPNPPSPAGALKGIRSWDL